MNCVLSHEGRKRPAGDPPSTIFASTTPNYCPLYTRPLQLTRGILKFDIMVHPNTRHVVRTGCRDYLFPQSIVSKYMSSPYAYYSLCSHSAGYCCLSKNKYVPRPAFDPIMSTASSPDGNSLDSGATFSLLLSSTMIRSNLSPPTTFSATFYPSSTQAVSPSSSLHPTTYSSKTI